MFKLSVEQSKAECFYSELKLNRKKGKLNVSRFVGIKMTFQKSFIVTYLFRRINAAYRYIFKLSQYTYYILSLSKACSELLMTINVSEGGSQICTHNNEVVLQWRLCKFLFTIRTIIVFCKPVSHIRILEHPYYKTIRRRPWIIYISREYKKKKIYCFTIFLLIM